MLRLVGCVVNQHDHRLLALAAFICLLSCLTASALLSRARVADRWLRVTWLAIAGLEFGGGVWSLHFIAMLGFMPGLAISYDVGETGWSIVVAVLGAFAGFAVGLSRLPVFVRVAAGAALLTISIGGMHYVGVAAMRLQGSFALDIGQVGLSLLACGLFGAASVLVMSDLRSLGRQSLLMLLLSLSICLLHFTGMSAMSLHFGGSGGSENGLLGSQTLAAAVGSISVALLLISLSLSIMDRHLSDRSTLEEQRLRKMAHHDALTGLANRLLLDIELTRALQRARQQGSGAAVLCLDLDRFKFVNDLLGHLAGDRLLVAVSERLTSLVRRSDVVARVGGDEFAILLPDVTDPAACMALARLIAEAVAEPVLYEDQQMVVGVSIGIAMYPQDGQTAHELLRRADVALYRAKEDRRGTARMFAPEMDAVLQHRRLLERDLRAAIGGKGLEVYYQPLVNCEHGQVEGFEALLRWNHPTRGQITPTEFIPIAEESGLIVLLGRWVLNEACRTASTWETPLRVAVNLSPTQFKQGDLVEQIAAALEKSGLEPNRLEVEVTEGVLIDDPGRAVATLSAVREMGVRVSLDDFGTGYSSLSYLRVFPLDKIKIDRSFVMSLGMDERSTEIVRSIVMLAHSLDLSVTAEGVETPEQLAILQSHDCNQVQGYLLGHPAAAGNIVLPGGGAEAVALAVSRSNNRTPGSAELAA